MQTIHHFSQDRWHIVDDYNGDDDPHCTAVVTLVRHAPIYPHRPYRVRLLDKRATYYAHDLDDAMDAAAAS